MTQVRRSPGAGAPDTSPRGGRKRKSPSDLRREARRAITNELKARTKAWAEGGRPPLNVAACDRALEEAYGELRAPGGARAGDVADDFRSRSASYVSPPMPPTPRKWRGER